MTAKTSSSNISLHFTSVGIKLYEHLYVGENGNVRLAT